MKKIYILVFVLLLAKNFDGFSQTFYSNNALFYVGGNSIVAVNGDAVIAGNSSFTNKGIVEVNNLSALPNKGNLDILNNSTVQGSGNYLLDGHWTNNATFICDTSEVIFKGDYQAIQGSSVTAFYDISLNGTGTDSKELKINALNKRFLHLNNRNLYTGIYNFTVDTSLVNSITYGSGYVSSDDGGYLARKMNGVNNYEFPVGSAINNFRFRPIYIDNYLGNTQYFGVRLANLEATLEGYDVQDKDSSLCLVNDSFYHQISRIAGVDPVHLEIKYDNTIDFNASTIAQWNGSEWTDIGPVSITNNASPTLSNAYKISHINFNEIAFALALKGILVSEIIQPVTCNGFADGQIIIQPSGGSSGLQINWNPIPSSNDTLINLAPGYYSYVVSDSLGCNKTDSILITQPNVLSSTNIYSDSLTCAGDSNGFIILQITGGTPIYNIVWSNGLNNDTLQNLSAGLYYVTISDQNNCTKLDSFEIAEPFPLFAISSGTKPDCYGDSNGVANIFVSPFTGTPPFTYLWGASAGNQTTPSAYNLAAGLYSVLVTDSNNCEKYFYVNIQNPDSLYSNTQMLAMEGCGMCNGEGLVNGFGGTGALTYQWDNGNTSNSINTFCGGWHLVTVTDAKNCKVIDSLEITVDYSVGGPLVSFSSTSSSCDVSLNGSITANPTTGTYPYTFEWDANTGNQTSQTAIQLNPGTYYVVVKDSNQCVTDTFAVVLDSLDYPQIQISAINPSCYGFTDGTASALVTNGNPSYSYNWSTGDNNDSIQSLSPGWYYLEVIDQLGCKSIDSTYIDSTPSLLPSITGNQAICEGDTTQLIASGAVGVIGYIWNTGETTPSIHVNPSNDTLYYVEVTNGICFETDSFWLEVRGAPSLVIEGPDEVCDSSTSTLTAISDNGTHFIWSTGDTTSSIAIYSENGITQYSVTVTDNIGCKMSNDSEPFTLTIHPLPIALFDTTKSSPFIDVIAFNDQSTSDITSWNWSFGDGNTANIQNPVNQYTKPGEYEVMLIVTNSFGCVDTSQALVSIYEGIEIPNVFSPNGDNKNDFFTIPTSGIEDFELTIYNRWGQEIYYINSSRLVWDGRTFSGEQVPAGTYYFVMSGKGSKEYVETGYITLVR